VNSSRNDAAIRLDELLEKRQSINERAYRRFEAGMSPIFTFEMGGDLEYLESLIGRVIADIRAAAPMGRLPS
jgi:hypothetical protein